MRQLHKHNAGLARRRDLSTVYLLTVGAISDNPARNAQARSMEKHSRPAVVDVNVGFDNRILSQTRDWSQYSYRWRPWRQRITNFTKIVDANYQGGGVPEDPFIVKWLDNDPEDPQTYSTWFKITNLIICGLMCFCITLASSAYTAVAKQVMDELDCSREVFLVGLSLMLVGFAVGPVLFAPLSEAFGRRNVVLTTLAIHTLWAGLCCVAQNIQTLLVFRLFCGIFGSPAVVIPAGQLADIFGPKERGLAMAVFAAAPWLGPTVSVTLICWQRMLLELGLPFPISDLDWY